MTELNPRLTGGVWGVLATPFVGDDRRVDIDSLQRQIAHYATIGAQGVVALGVFGESSKLSETEKRTIVRGAVEAAGTASVIVGLSSLATSPALAEADACLDAADGQVRALMVQACSGDPDVLIDHLQRIHAATGVDTVLQDYPIASGVHVSSDAIVAAAETCSFVVAVKAEAPPTAVAIAQITARTDVAVFGGLGGVGLVDELAAGGAGAMTGFSHPEALALTLEAFEQDGFVGASAALAPWLPLANFEGQPGIGLAIRKHLLCARGVIAEPGIRPPGRELPAELHPLIHEHAARARTLLGTA